MPLLPKVKKKNQNEQMKQFNKNENKKYLISLKK